MTVTWQIGGEVEDGEFLLQWVESDGPAVQAPAARGFGTSLGERGLAHELSGSASIRFEPSGIRASLRAPLGVAINLASSAGAGTGT